MNSKKRKIRISPSMMCADYLHLQDEIDIFEETGIDYLHMDIMDAHYVPNLTLGPGFCRALAKASSLPLDIHLMIENVDAYVPSFTGFADITLSFHPEVCYHPLRTIDLIRRHDARPGIAVDPAQPLEALRHLLPAVDFICMMTVNPGYSGQKLLPGALDKITEFVRYREEQGLDYEIEVDGNVSWEHIPAMISAGAETLVTGTSSIFDGTQSRKENILRLQKIIA
jgi:ribulose-phosphate 3-epimerase